VWFRFGFVGFSGWVSVCCGFCCWGCVSCVFSGFGCFGGSGFFFDCLFFRSLASAQMNAIDADAPM